MKNKKSIWLQQIEAKCEEISSSFDQNRDTKRILGLTDIANVPNTASKIEKCAKSCKACVHKMSDLVDYLNEVGNLLHNKTWIQVNSTQLRLLNEQKYRPITNHLIKKHGYYLSGTYKTRFALAGIISGLLLYWFISDWPLWLSIFIGLAYYLIGRGVDKKYKKRGLFIK